MMGALYLVRVFKTPSGVFQCVFSHFSVHSRVFPTDYGQYDRCGEKHFKGVLVTEIRPPCFSGFVWVQETYDINNTPQEELLAMIREERSREAILSETSAQLSRRSVRPTDAGLWANMRDQMLDQGKKHFLCRAPKPRNHSILT